MQGQLVTEPGVRVWLHQTMTVARGGSWDRSRRPEDPGGHTRLQGGGKTRPGLSGHPGSQRPRRASPHPLPRPPSLSEPLGWSPTTSPRTLQCPTLPCEAPPDPAAHGDAIFIHQLPSRVEL